ncbi:EAL domain-containing protein (putative c-di-GMP-specific phosphodiesterase class I) [Virgibacillus natechei]|uniref:EAL domain-containing protein (Putative c-di-GMP-specific phosphodiesterase class I) n=1 Tax=Virgibacillus natechei TaxID=1216297 RepID=A0ABS4IJK7_9BACI|nr:EAL domain-containing protein [Virgibacillus natechei]MBP1971099.1 EAL domain-containing protein (putative c-di-GMP-specific phosphodiesterase class I) [Virgibacillus natechei]UZD12214.1 EAL domain-containing protein [Virgibacillus natechei]
MDPLDIMLDSEKVIPYYQPIISADTQLVSGYEVRAHFLENERNAQQLDWFFEDTSIPHDFHLELNNWIHAKAVKAFLMTDQSTNLFLHYDARLLLNDNADTLLALLYAYKEQGLDFTRIIIELKEPFIKNQLDDFRPLFSYIKTLGIRIALDDVGKKNGNLDHLAILKPNIVKVDAGFLKDDLLPHLHRDVHHSLTMLSRTIGAALLFKNISSYNQLNYAWRNGGRYYQGAYIKRIGPDFVEPDGAKEKIKTDFQHFITFERKKMTAQMELTNLINKQFTTTLSTITSSDPYDDIILAAAHACDRFVFRVYICNEEGIQLSSNADKNKDGEWELTHESRQKNWSWRPYFFENIVRMNIEKKGILSDLYTDIEKDEQIKTFSYPITDTLYIFLDVPFDYLYEQEGLL